MNRNYKQNQQTRTENEQASRTGFCFFAWKGLMCYSEFVQRCFGVCLFEVFPVCLRVFCLGLHGHILTSILSGYLHSAGCFSDHIIFPCFSLLLTKCCPQCQRKALFSFFFFLFCTAEFLTVLHCTNILEVNIIKEGIALRRGEAVHVHGKWTCLTKFLPWVLSSWGGKFQGKIWSGQVTVS